MGNWKFTIGSNRFLNQRLNHFLLFLCASLPATAPVLSWPFPLNKIMCRPCSHWPSNVTTPYSQSVTIGKNSISLTLQTQTFTKSLTFVSKARSFVQIGEWILNQRLERSMFWKAKWEILKSGLIFIISFSAFITCSCRFRGLHFLFTNLRSKKKKKLRLHSNLGVPSLRYGALYDFMFPTHLFPCKFGGFITIFDILTPKRPRWIRFR